MMAKHESDSVVKEVLTQGDATILKLAGEIDMNHSQTVHSTVREVLEPKPAKFVIDLSEVTYIDSSGVSTLVNALLHHFEKLAHGSGYERPGIVHRLDKNTSGLILVAKTDDIYLKLQQQMQKREIKRTYLALICGHVREEEGVIDLPIGRSLKDRKKMIVTNVGSREAKTSYKLKDRFRSYDLLEVLLHTGRTHQIRVHFSHLGHPVFDLCLADIY